LSDWNYYFLLNDGYSIFGIRIALWSNEFMRLPNK
jgi:hypothetical protein